MPVSPPCSAPGPNAADSPSTTYSCRPPTQPTRQTPRPRSPPTPTPPTPTPPSDPPATPAGLQLARLPRESGLLCGAASPAPPPEARPDAGFRARDQVAAPVQAE